jgi:hypothetical protein
LGVSRESTEGQKTPFNEGLAGFSRNSMSCPNFPFGSLPRSQWPIRLLSVGFDLLQYLSACLRLLPYWWNEGILSSALVLRFPGLEKRHIEIRRHSYPNFD